MSGSVQSDPLLELWLRARDALAPFGIQVGREVLALWRDQQNHGHGPLMRAALIGERRQVDEVIALLQELVGVDEQDGAPVGQALP